MEDWMAMVMPWIEWIRMFLLKVSTFIANGTNLPVDNVHLIVLLGVSYFVGRKIFDIFYSDTKGRTHYLLLISGAIFYILKYL